MSYSFDDYIDDLNDHEQELIKFECWYHSTIDDVAQMILSNGYDVVMLDIMKAVERIKNTQSNIQE